MTRLSEYVDGVAKRHAEASRQMFPGYAVHSVTNGVHASTWTSASIAKMYDQYVPGWCHEPELRSRADRIPDETLWAAHQEAKLALVDKVRELSGVVLNPDQPILGLARRMAAYKRADLLFTDLARLKTIAQEHPFQIVMARKAHPMDAAGKLLIEALHVHMRDLAGVIPMAFLPDYDMAPALHMVSGSDVWINTPLRTLEASGTSGMKAAFNGVPQLSVLDGWWVEGCLEGVTGWAVGDARPPQTVTIPWPCTTSLSKWYCRFGMATKLAGSPSRRAPSARMPPTSIVSHNASLRHRGVPEVRTAAVIFPEL